LSQDINEADMPPSQGDAVLDVQQTSWPQSEIYIHIDRWAHLSVLHIEVFDICILSLRVRTAGGIKLLSRSEDGPGIDLWHGVFSRGDRYVTLG